MKKLDEMTRKEIELYLIENNMHIKQAYKLNKSQLIEAVEKGIKNEELFDPDKKYAFSKEKCLKHMKETFTEKGYNSVISNDEQMAWFDEIDGKEVKMNYCISNTAYIEDKDYENFKRCECIEIVEVEAEKEESPVIEEKIVEISKDTKADKLVKEHQQACKKANSHCIYSREIYSESCIKCFALWLLNNKSRVYPPKKKILVDEYTKREVLKEIINEDGRYNEYSERYSNAKELFDSEEDFFNFYDEIAHQESYEVKVIFSTVEDDELESVSEEDLEEDKYIWNDICSYLYDLDADDVTDCKLAITCIGDKELKELEEYLEDENQRFYLNESEITTEYGIEGTCYKPIKNKDIKDIA